MAILRCGTYNTLPVIFDFRLTSYLSVALLPRHSKVRQITRPWLLWPTVEGSSRLQLFFEVILIIGLKASRLLQISLIVLIFDKKIVLVILISSLVNWVLEPLTFWGHAIYRLKFALFWIRSLTQASVECFGLLSYAQSTRFIQRWYDMCRLITNIRVDNILGCYQIWLHLVRLLKNGAAGAGKNCPLLFVKCFDICLDFV